eukprot:10868011-Alexandrium_andersonii.AAC.1
MSARLFHQMWPMASGEVCATPLGPRMPATRVEERNTARPTRTSSEVRGARIPSRRPARPRRRLWTAR